MPHRQLENEAENSQKTSKKTGLLDGSKRRPLVGCFHRREPVKRLLQSSIFPNKNGRASRTDLGAKLQRLLWSSLSLRAGRSRGDDRPSPSTRS